MKTLLPYIIKKLKKYNIRYKVHSFDSRAVMVDIWMGNDFHVIQINGDNIGLSLITEETMPFDIIPNQTFTKEALFKKAFDPIFHNMEPRKTIIINGNNFSTLEGFYAELDNVLTKNLEWTTGHNLNAFNDLLRGGFGVHEYEEPIKLVWKNAAKSKADLNEVQQQETLYEMLKSIIEAHKHIEFIEA